MSLYTKRIHLKNHLHLNQINSTEQQIQKISQQSSLPQQKINCRQKINDFISLQGFAVFMSIITIYSIFAVDFSKAFLNGGTAVYFSIVHIIVISIFSIEIVLNGLAKNDYVLGFYFWIDLFSTLTMILEINWIQNFLYDNSNIPVVLTFAKVIKASRLSKVGARAAKVVELLIQIIRTRKRQEEKEKQLEQQRSNEDRNQQAQKTNEIQDKIEFNFHMQETIPHQIRVRSPIVDKYPTLLQKIDENIQKSLSQMESDEIDQENEKAAKSIMTFNRSPTQQIEVEFKLRPHQNNLDCLSLTNPFLSMTSKRAMNLKRMNSNRSKTQFQKKTQRLNQLSNINERLQKCIILEPLYRPNVDPVKNQEIQLKWKEIYEKEQEQKRKTYAKFKCNQQNFKLGQTLKLKIQKNIIIMIMGLVICLPMITTQTWIDKDPNLASQFLQTYLDLAQLSPNASYQSAVVDNFIQTGSSMTEPIVFFTLQSMPFSLDPLYFSVNNISAISTLMQTEKEDWAGDYFSIIFSLQNYVHLSADLSLLRSIFITILLIFSSIIFMYSIQKYALIPLEQMCICIDKISLNPFQALKQINTHKQQQAASPQQNQKGDLETKILQKVIIKMTNLLALGAGEVGSQIIQTKVDDINSTNQYFSQGTKIAGIFMYIKISNFQKYCQNLSNDLITYINGIAKEVHQICIRYGGTPIQNDGSGFLLFWKINDHSLLYENQKSFSFIKSQEKTQELPRTIELVLISYIKINIALTKLIKPAHLEQTKDKLEEEAQQFAVHAGIHLGIGVEGFLGSNQKLESKCLSYDVEYTKQLCSLAKKYKVNSVISEEICNSFQDIDKVHIRKMDYIKIKNSDDCYWIYTLDFSVLSLLSPAKNMQKSTRNRKKEKKKTQFIVQQKQELYKKRSDILEMIRSNSIHQIIEFDSKIQECQKFFNREFYDSWNEGLQRYYLGQWDHAASIFQSINQSYQSNVKDPLSTLFLNRIDQASSFPPQGWLKYQQISLE